MRHSSARNVVERIFGVLKRRFRILLLPAEFSIEIQAQIPTALCAVHNFIRKHDSLEDDLDSDETGDDEEHAESIDDLGTDGAAEIDSDDSVQAMHDRIAEAMWVDYQRLLEERDAGESDSSIATDISENDQMIL